MRMILMIMSEGIDDINEYKWYMKSVWWGRQLTYFFPASQPKGPKMKGFTYKKTQLHTWCDIVCPWVLVWHAFCPLLLGWPVPALSRQRWRNGDVTDGAMEDPKNPGVQTQLSKSPICGLSMLIPHTCIFIYNYSYIYIYIFTYIYIYSCIYIYM